MMKYALKKYAPNVKSGAWWSILLVGCLVFITACGEVDENDGTVINSVPLPTDTALNLYCADVGIAGETCVLDDPDNPYARTPFDITQLFEELDVDAPGPKARFYLWATAQARSPQGVYQYFTAVNLHRLFGENGSELIREQAKRAYRSLLDNYFDSAWFLKVETPQGDILFPEKLKDAVGINIYDPADPDALQAGLVPLYGSQLLALQDLGEWGYAYDIENKIVSVVE